VVAQSEIVVGSQIDDALPVVRTDGGLFVIEYAQPEESSTLAKIVELRGKMRELRAFH